MKKFSLLIYIGLFLITSQICQDIEKHMTIIGSYNDVIIYANHFGFKISRIVSINETTQILYYWVTNCFGI